MTALSQNAMPMAPLRGFAPVLSPDIDTIILGSFPSRESLAAQAYYAHPTNQFWRLLSHVFQEDIYQLPYEERLKRLLFHRVGLWDVVSMCEREGSLDARIKHPLPNDFDQLKKQCPLLKRIFFNGKFAAAYEKRLTGAGYICQTLPSSSAAHAAMSFQTKCDKWQSITKRQIQTF